MPRNNQTLVPFDPGRPMLARLCSRPRGASNDAGTTMLEVMVVVAMVGVLTAITVWGIQEWATASAFKGAPQQVQSVLRTTQQRAITEGTSYCVKFDTENDQYSVFRFACSDTGTPVKTAGPFGTGSGEVHLSGFENPPGVAQTGVTFSPRGSASPGQVAVVRDGVSRLVLVEGMTGRVSTS